MNINGPYATAALLCEHVLDEKDGRISCIRVLDRIEINATLARPLRPGEATPTLPTPTLQLTGLLILKSGDFVGKKVLRINIYKPSGELMKPEGPSIEALPLFFEGGEQGVQIILNISLKIENEGLYLIDALLDDENIVARIPLRVTITHTQADDSQPAKPMSPDDKRVEL
jgi:hypothetical protein